MNKILFLMLLSLLWIVNCYADSSDSNTSVSRAQYMANEGLMGVHVPVSIPQNPSLRPQELRDVDLFTEPGESRDILSVTPRVEKN